MSMLRRRMMMIQAAQEHTLPSEYEQIEYIQSNVSNTGLGTYINTGIVLGTNPTVEVVFQQLALTAAGDLFGNGTVSTGVIELCSYYARYDYITLWHGGGWLEEYSLSANNTLNNVNKYTYTNSSFSINDDLIFQYAPYTTPTSNTFTIFYGRPAAFNGNGVAGRISGKLFSCKIKEGNELVLDLVPALRTSDGIAGMYDFVSGNFLTNAYYSTTIGGYPNFLYER